jgi:hypothetical protein
MSYFILDMDKEYIMFYCRDEELHKLNKRYDNDAFECIIIYGRIRVGKTALYELHGKTGFKR